MSNLISAEGLKKLIEEYDYLWKVERPKVVRGVADAAAEGDRSENAEYIYGKRRLREIDSKLKHLGSRLKVLKVADPLPDRPSAVSFGCWVTYEEESGTRRCYQLVGPEETDVSTGRISIDSPVGRALLNMKVDDEVTVKRPDGEIILCITGIFSTRPEF
jgi:transcription elongation factor GreB